jgi:drug/metabolite transporter (DMT)-like permease
MLIWLVSLFGLIIFELVADVLAKEYSLHGAWYRWLLAIGAYVVANTFWLYAIKNGSGLARGAIIFSVSTAVIAVIIGMFYREQLGKMQMAGVLLGIVSLILIFWRE